jgi:hypothetical protein
MRKYHPKNERIKRQYLAYLEEAKRLSPKSTDQVAAAIAAFEASTGYKDFAQFHIDDPVPFFGPPEGGVSGLLIRSHSLDRRKVEFPACFTAAGWLRRRGSATRSEAYGRSPRAGAPRCSI